MRISLIPKLPTQSVDAAENEFVSVQRSLSWMAHRIASREGELRNSIAELRAAKDRLELQERALRDANGRLAVLWELSARVRSLVRKTDVAARVGGEEFAVLLSGVGAADAVRIAGAVHEAIRSCGFDFASDLGTTLRVTCSVGICALFDRPLARADLLYKLADAYDAMTSNRAYRLRLSPEAALREIERGSGAQFEPEVAAAFLDMARAGAVA